MIEKSVLLKNLVRKVSQMVYCNLIKNDNDSVTYAYGGDYTDVSGEVVFKFSDDTIEIVKKPKTEDAPIRHIKRLYGIHRENFKKGVFKEKISYES